jgi:multiple sugar transport system permease protein
MSQAVRSTSNTRARRAPSVTGLIRVGLLVVCALFFGVPLVWLALAPSKLNNEITNLPPLAFGVFDNYGRALGNLLSYNHGQILTWVGNSVWYTVASVVLGQAIAIPAGYALATARFRGRRLILWVTLIALIVPTSALVLPLFLELNVVGLVGSPWSVILPEAFFPFGVYLAYVFYATALPKDLLAAGRTDGASEWQLFRYVCLPLSGTLIGLLTFLSFVANWNNYFLPYVMLSDDKSYTLAVGLQALVVGTPMVAPNNAGTDTLLKRPEGALIGLLMVLPLALVFVAAQRYVVRGALTGSIKE